MLKDCEKLVDVHYSQSVVTPKATLTSYSLFLHLAMSFVCTFYMCHTYLNMLCLLKIKSYHNDVDLCNSMSRQYVSAFILPLLCCIVCCTERIIIINNLPHAGPNINIPGYLQMNAKVLNDCDYIKIS